MILVWNGWHIVEGTEPCLFCQAQTKDLCLIPSDPRKAREARSVCAGCRRVLKKLRMVKGSLLDTD